MKTYGIIPARYASSRLPGKPLADIAGKSMIERVYRRCASCAALDTVIVATDDARIFDHVSAWGGAVEMTDPGHVSGTLRIAEVAARHPEAGRIINIQGDEPFIDPQQLAQLAAALNHADLATLVTPLDAAQRLYNPSVVKVVADLAGFALYFSRAAIPFLRDESELLHWPKLHPYLQHIGVYGFRRETLLEICSLPESALERAEQLEQLRWLEAGYRIRLVQVASHGMAVDTPEDLERARELAGMLDGIA